MFITPYGLECRTKGLADESPGQHGRLGYQTAGNPTYATSLFEYVLIVQVKVMRRSKHWLPEYYFLDDTVTFELIGLTLSVEVIYDRVDNADMNEFR